MTHAMTRNSAASSLFGAVAFSALLGVAAGFLLAPKSGKATRDDLTRKMRDAQARSRNKAADMKADAAAKIDSMRSKTDQVAEETKATAQEAVNEARSQVDDATTKAKTQTTAHPRTRQTPQ